MKVPARLSSFSELEKGRSVASSKSAARAARTSATIESSHGVSRSFSSFTARPFSYRLIRSTEHRRFVTQRTTRSFRRPHFEVYVSQLVLDEANADDSEAAARPAEFVAGLPLLDIASAAVVFARRLATADTLHIATAACHGIEYLMTWNSAHIANAECRTRVERDNQGRLSSPAKATQRGTAGATAKRFSLILTMLVNISSS